MLTVCPGIIQTNVVNAVVLDKISIPGDYSRSVAEHTMHLLSSGKLFPNGDKDKAIMALYEVVFGKGGGAGREVERFLPFGTDVAARVNPVQRYFLHDLEVFGDVTNDVSIAGLSWCAIDQIDADQKKTNWTPYVTWICME